MGHIVGSSEIKILETNNNHHRFATNNATLRTASIVLPSSPALSPNANLLQSPINSLGVTSRRFLSYFGCSWNDCVQGVSSLLPSPYAEKWLCCLEQLMHYEGPLPESWRIYIAIMALCRHEVTWAVRALTYEFVSSDGDRKWLSGLRFAPRKLQRLSSINNILAHRPWLLTSQHILDVTKGEESWSISELCQALCLMTHFHAFASFLHACLPLPPTSSSSSSFSPSSSSSLPLSPLTSPAKTHLPSSLPDKLKDQSAPVGPAKGLSEDNLNDSSKVPPPVTLASIVTNSVFKISSLFSSTNSSSSSSTATASAVKTSNGVPEVSSPASPNGPSSLPISIPEQPPTKDAVAADDACIETKTTSTTAAAKREIQASPQPSKQSKNDMKGSRSLGYRGEESPSCLREFPHLCNEISFAYKDFTTTTESPSSNAFKVREFNWQEHGYSLMTRLLNEMGNLIDERFGAVKALAHPSWIRNKDNAYHYRKAVWNYIQSLFGIEHDDYVYSHIDIHLSREVKKFVKRSCCDPESIEGTIPSSLLASSDAVPAQLVPLCIIIMEARVETELLYALKAIIPHQR